MLKVQFFFLVESIAIGKPIRGGRGVDPYTVLLRDAIPAVFYLSQDTSILRGTITLRERRGSLGWRRSLDGGGGVDSSLYKPYRYVHAASPGGVLGLFGMKMGTHFLYFALESRMVFKGTRDNMNVFIVSIPNE